MAAGKFKKFFSDMWHGMKKVFVPVGKTILKAAPVIGGAIGSIVPGVGTTLGTGIGTTVSGLSKKFGLI